MKKNKNHLVKKGDKTIDPSPGQYAMTVHHQSHHVAALSGITVQTSSSGGGSGSAGGGGGGVVSGSGGLNLTRMSNLEAHHRGIDNIERLTNTIESSHNINNNNNNNSERPLDISMTMPQRSRFMITDILADASSPSSLQSQEPPGSPPLAPRDLSLRHQSNRLINNLKRKRDDDSDTSHHDGASVSSNGKIFILVHQLFFCFYIPKMYL